MIVLLPGEVLGSRRLQWCAPRSQVPPLGSGARDQHVHLRRLHWGHPLQLQPDQQERPLGIQVCHGTVVPVSPRPVGEKTSGEVRSLTGIAGDLVFTNLSRAPGQLTGPQCSRASSGYSRVTMVTRGSMTCGPSAWWAVPGRPGPGCGRRLCR